MAVPEVSLPSDEVRVWHCTCLFSPPPSSSSSSSPSSSTSSASSALIILNTPIVSPSIFSTLWTSAALRLCADGGANRLFDLTSPTSSHPRHSLLPGAILGDLDSLRPDVEDFYRQKRVPIIKDDDQFSTDLGKCLVYILKEGRDARDVTVHGGLSGRLDQTVHTVHTLMALELGSHPSLQSPPYQRWESRRRRRGEGREEIWVVDTDARSAACFLGVGRHRIRVAPPGGWAARIGEETRKKKPRTCGLLPIGCDKAVWTSRGLEWDLTEAVTTMTGMVSSSNQISSQNDDGSPREWVEIDVLEGGVVWTMELLED